MLLLPQRYVFSSKSQLKKLMFVSCNSCYCYHKGTYFQANHNRLSSTDRADTVVIATTKVRIFKQITTHYPVRYNSNLLLLLPQRYVFSSKSQQVPVGIAVLLSCYCYHKGTYFQANHNVLPPAWLLHLVVIATTKVRIFKQITTLQTVLEATTCCYCYHKGTYFQANHNWRSIAV